MPGLNVVTGSSNTGKSFMVELIQYALGKQEMTKQIVEAQPYDRVRLAIESDDGKVYSILRALTGGDAIVWEGDEDVPPENHRKLPVRSSPRETGTLPGFLLELTGLQDKRIKSKQAETRNLSFRDLRKLVVMDEERIISTTSPAQGGEITERTSDASVLTLLLTGVDDSAMVVAEQVEGKRQEQRLQAEKIAYMIDELRTDIPESSSLRSAQAQLKRLEESIATARGSYNEGFTSVSRIEAQRGRLIRQQTDIAIRTKSLNQLVERFRVLEGKYKSDLERLSAMGEAAAHFGSLEKRNCPVCGSPLSEKTEHHEPTQEDTDALYAGLQAERQKIMGLQLDLRNTIENLVADIASYSEQGKEIAQDIRAVEEQLDRKLKPAARELSQKIGELEEKRTDVRRLVTDMERIERYKNQRLQIVAELKTLTVPTSERNDTKAKFDFSLEVEEVLKAWKYPDAGRVQFEQTDQDVAINGKRRSSLGKGYRAVTASAFLIALLEYCQANKLPHPGFVVLDTPLRTFKDREQVGAGEIISDEVKDAFFRDLASRDGNRQFIVLENDDAPADVRETINYIHFSGNPARPPAGFIPARYLP